MIRYQLSSISSCLRLHRLPVHSAEITRSQQWLPNTIYDAGCMTLPAFLANNLEHCSMLDLSNKSHNKVCSLCSRIMCDYKIYARRCKTYDTCSDLAYCEPTVRIRMCDHVFGARYLVQHIRAGKYGCPTCTREWFRLAVEFRREMSLKESRLWSWCWGWDMGHGQDLF